MKALSPEQKLINGFIASGGVVTDRLNQHPYDPSLHEASIAIGRVCCKLDAKDNLHGARSLIRQARGRLAAIETPAERPWQGASVDLFSAELNLIAEKENPARLSKVFQAFSDTTYDWLERSVRGHWQAFSSRSLFAETQWKGLVTELTAITLLNRCLPQAVAMPALLHNESASIGNANRNYDFIFAQIDQDQPDASVHHVQVKSACVGLRPGHTGLRKLRNYNRNVVLLSGCCDLGMQLNPDGHGHSLDLAHLILKDSVGTLPDWSQDYLDLRAHSLAEELTSDQRNGILWYQEASAS